MERHVRARIFSGAGTPQGPADAIPDIEKKKARISDVKAFHNFLSGHEFTNKIGDLLNRSHVSISVSFFLLSCLTLGACSLAVSRYFLSSLYSVPLAVAMGFSPFFYLRWRSKRYLLKFSEFLPNALSVIKNAIKVGHGLETSMEAVVQAVPYPVSEEFRMVRTEMKLGQSIQVALQNLYQRIGTQETKIFVTGINIHQELGGNLSEILENLETTIRERFALEREVKALSAQGVMTSWVLCAIPLVLTGIWFFNDPTTLTDFAHSEIGKKGIAVAVFCQIVAFLWMRRIIQLKD